jgi:ABC-2 type transport system permease protein
VSAGTTAAGTARPSARRPGRPGDGDRPSASTAERRWEPLRDAVHAEWTKLRTLPGTYYLLAALLLATTALSVLVSAAVTCPAPGCHADPARVSLTGVELGQAAVVVLATSAVGGEYATGMVRVTFAAMPGRLTVLAAKAAVLGALVLAVGVLAVAGSLAAGLLLLPGHGFTAAHGFAAFSATDAGLLRAAAGSALYLVLIALLSIGVTTIVRDSAVAVGTVLGLLYLFPIVISVVGDEKWHRRLEQIAPMNAGLAIQDTVGVATQPLSPWAGLGVLVCWAAGALALGGTLVRARDA